MENLLTASQAKELTMSNKRQIEEIIKGITVMANSGSSYCTYRRREVAEDVPDRLKELGYTIQLTDEHLSITW